MSVATIQTHLQRMNDQIQQNRLELMHLKQRVCASEARELLRLHRREPTMPVRFRAQFAEDATAWELLGCPLDGFFIEVGAFDGLNYSVTYALEALGWKGLLVEAIPQRSEQCRHNRRNSRVVHAALSRPGSPAAMSFTIANDQYGGMLSYLGENASAERDLQNASVAFERVSVPVTTMDHLLAEHKGPIDLASIDVEGGELALLEGFDLHKHRPRVLLLEDNSLGSDPALGAYMQSQPYVQVAWAEVNRVYVHRDERDILARCAVAA